MMKRDATWPVGARVTLKNDVKEYPLPNGLKSGDTVTAKGFDHEYYTVDKDGGEFTVFMVNFNSKK